MKKTIYSIIAVAAGVILASGCSKELNPVENKVTGEVTLSASLPGNLTKTAVDGSDKTKVNWSAGDTISVWGGENNKFTLSSGEGTTSGSFSGTVTSGTAQYAMYPYSATATIDADIITTNVPNTQTVPENSFDPAAAVMVGTISGTDITFHHALAYLKVTAPSEVTNLVEITIESNGGVQLTGDAKFAAADGAFTTTGTPCKYVTIKPSTGTFTASGIYYAAVIPGTYTGGLTVKYLYNDASAHTLTEKTKSSSTELALTTAGKAKLLGAATTFDHTYEAVQLWAGGPYWATTNIGATSETDCGQYFAWGYPTGQTPSGETFSTAFNQTNYPDVKQDTLDVAHDMATINWGTGWSVPTAEQLDTLVNFNHDPMSPSYGPKDCGKCSVSYVKTGVIGVRVTGTTSGYTSNSIFLPAAGCGNLNGILETYRLKGLYWSSVQVSFQGQDNGSAFALLLFKDALEEQAVVQSGQKTYGFSVRPVRSSL